MIRNFLKLAWRNIWRNKSFSFLNILGLTAGTVCCLYILLYVNDQSGYDRYHHEAESIYRVRTIVEPKGETDGVDMATSSPPIAMTMKQDFPEVMTATRVQYFSDQGEYLLNLPNSDNSFYESKGYLVDSSFFQVFDYKFLEGKPLHSLDEPNTVVLSSAVAKKLFGNSSALNEQIIITDNSSSTPFKVTGVFDETYGKSHLKPHFLMTMNSIGMGRFLRTNNQWAGQNFAYTYVRLNPNADAMALQQKLPAFLEKYGAENMKELGMKKHLVLQKVIDINLHSKGITSQIDKVSDAKFLNLLLTIAFFIQLIACINFINLTTARSMRRAREIGIRKVVGAVKSSLIMQFLGESIFISFIAILLAIPIVLILLPWLNTLTGSSLTPGILYNFNIISIIIVLGLITGLLSGIYPALYLSKFRPITVLKGVFSIKTSTISFRKILVVFQFAIALVLIVSVIVISRQINYMQSKDLGFNKEQKLVIPLKDQQARGQFDVFSNELSKVQDVQSTGGCAFYPSKNVLSDFPVYTAGKDMNSAELMRINRVSGSYFPSMGITIKEGRNFTAADTLTQTIVNEKALKVLNIDKKKAIGTRLYFDYGGGINEFEIVGVTADYNYASLKKEIEPLMSFYTRSPNYMIVNAKSSNFKNLLSELGTIWKKLVPTSPFQYTFLDEDLQKQYEEERTFEKISNSFTVLAILISCLGLFGLAMFTAQQRIKEIGIRKVLGASVTGIVSMLSKDFLKLVFISILIASPLSWWLMSKWLQDFAYKINIGPWVFLLAGMIALLIALLTVSFQAIKAAVVNPVRSLRTE
ncbi:MAG TPA: ABC transporter permease [Chitinophagaceae bacterium]|jgi:putative ABC transport system permease protein|nr:ABC transporter permease [Chitinophagaceae bacterium]